MRRLLLIFSVSLCLVVGIITSSMAAEWELVKSFRDVRMVYISPDGIADRNFIAQVLNKVVNKKECIRVFIFDDKKHTPVSLPMTDSQMLHWRAKYNLNPKAGIERFVFIKLLSAKLSPPFLREVEADIRP